jgi:hypothetical protein
MSLHKKLSQFHQLHILSIQIRTRWKHFYWSITLISQYNSILLSRVRGSTTNNNGLWIGWLALLTLLLQSLLFTINYSAIANLTNHWDILLLVLFCACTLNCTVSQSQKLLYYWLFAPISSSWSKASWDSRPEIFFQLNSCGISPYVTSSLTRWWVCLLWICLAFRQVYFSHIYHVIENSSVCTTHKSFVSTRFAEKTMPILRISYYNVSLVNWTVVSLTTAKFMSGFVLSYTTNMFILMIL